MIRVIFRRKLAPGQTEESFAAAWTRAMEAVCAKAPGSRGGCLLHSFADPTTFISVMNWESIEDWRAYWTAGLPDPEGDPERNEILVEVVELGRGGASG